MLEPSTSISKHCDILVTRVVCRVQQGTLPVQVRNVTNDGLMLKSGIKVYTLFTDIEVGDEVAEQHGASDRGKSLQPWTVETLMSQFGMEEKGFSKVELKAVRQLLHKNITVFSQGETDST